MKLDHDVELSIVSGLLSLLTLVIVAHEMGYTEPEIYAGIVVMNIGVTILVHYVMRWVRHRGDR